MMNKDEFINRVRYPISEIVGITQDLSQNAILDWVAQCFGPEWTNKNERSCRFIEEAIELVQACDLPKEMVLKLVDRVYSKPKGDIYQEIGGASVTLMALCEKNGISRYCAEEDELGRCLDADKDKFRAKHQIKQDLGLVGFENK
jgi:hypothetical protein